MMSKKNVFNTEDFIKKSIELYGDKYDYSLVQYTLSKNSVKIICSRHGIFEKIAGEHLRGVGCKKCGIEKRGLGTLGFIENAKKIHNGRYDYSLVDYTKLKGLVKIICSKHGVFEQIAYSHLNGFGCKKCGIDVRKEKISSNTDEFIKKAKLIHGHKYDYSLVDYNRNYIPVKIICLIHGIFEQLPNTHLGGSGCNSCSIEIGARKRSINNDIFIKKAKLIHGDKYDYSLVDYSVTHNKIILICSIHGKFKQTPNSHLKGRGCPKCGDNRKGKYRLLNTEEFIERAKEIHGDKYDYSEVEYEYSMKKVKIICKKHGIFKQRPNNHLYGLAGCPICNESKGENKIRLFLKKNNITYVREKRFTECRNKKPLPFDFYLPNNNTLIEYDGIQHFMIVWSKYKFENIRNNDNIKTNFAKNNNIELIRISYLNFDNIENILESRLK